MTEHQKSIISKFFEQIPDVSPTSCHEYVREHITPALLPAGADGVGVQPGEFQDSQCYTCILTGSNQKPIFVQFRIEKQDLSGTDEANRVHGDEVALPLTFKGTYQGLFVYTSPATEGMPYINLLMDPHDLPLQHKMTTALDLADIFCRGARRPDDIAQESGISTVLDKAQSTVDSHVFQNPALKDTISTCISKLRPKASELAKTLPLVLTHQDLTPWNYLVDSSSGHVTSVMEWQGSRYLPIGSNFHFIDACIFGNMSRKGWEHAEGRQELETAFYARVQERLTAQGFENVSRERIELQKPIGMLQYWVLRLEQGKTDQAEQMLEGHLSGLPFM